MSTTFTADRPDYFEVYCPKDYDKHSYKMVFKNGKKVVYNDYKVMRHEWYTHRKLVDYVEVVDKSGKGF